MIRRLVEYAVACDALDCNESHLYGSFTREQCHQHALEHGWQPTTRGRWLCPYCKERAEKKLAGGTIPLDDVTRQSLVTGVKHI